MADENEVKRAAAPGMKKDIVGNRYFKIEEGYNKGVYENTIGNWFKIIGAFILFYLSLCVYWWGIFNHGINSVDSATILYLIVFGLSIMYIGILLCCGHVTTKKLERYQKLMLEINEVKKNKRQEEERAKKRLEAQEEKKKLIQKEIDYSSEEADEDENEEEADEDENEEEDGQQPSESQE